MKVSIYYNPKNPTERPHNKEEYGQPSDLIQLEFKEVLANCFNIQPDTVKGGSGCMFVFVSPENKFHRNETIVEENITTDGACFCDVDELKNNLAVRDLIWKKMEEIRKYLPNLQAVWMSYSGNLHICFWTEALNADEYRTQELLGLLYFAIVVKKVCGIVLTDKSSGDKPNLDTHNSTISQRFDLNRITKDSVQYFDSAVPCNFKLFTKEERQELRNTWPSLVSAFENSLTKKSQQTYINTKVEYEINQDNNRSDMIDYIEHRTRWNIYTCLATLLKDKDTTEEEWRKFALRISPSHGHDTQFFINEPNKINNWWKDRHPHPNYDLLTKYGYSIKKLEEKNNYCIKKGEWLVKYKDEVLDFINKNHHSEIVSPTGTGKTTFINGEDEKDDIIFSQELFSLTKELNAIVIVPFNVTNKLYGKLIEVNASWRGEIKEDKQYVMIWDQALRYWDKIKDRTLIIDEAHCLFLDRTYRDVAVKLMNKIKEDDCKIVLFTATPSGEAEELGCNQLIFTNERNVININFIKVNSVDRAQLGAINRVMDNKIVDRIVLFDDLHAKKIYENLMIEGKYINDISYIRADTKDSDDFIYLRENELLNKKLTICTCVAFNGLNFKNENENILVITSYKHKDTTAAKIIQESGRIRNSNVMVIVYYDDIEYNSSLENRIEKAEIMNDAVLNLGIPDNLLSYDRRLLKEDIVDALRRIEARLNEDSKLDVIIQKLLDTGYFIIHQQDFQSDDWSKGDKLQLAIKKKCSDEFIDDLLNEQFGEYKENSYKWIWKNKIDKMINNDSYRGIDLDTFKNIIDKKNKKTLIETVINNVDRIIRVSLLDDIQWNNYTTKIEILKNSLKQESDKRDLANNYKKNLSIRNKYKDKVKLVDNNIIDLNPIFNDLFEELEYNYNKEKESKGNAGKKSKKVGKPVIIEGKQYSSAKEAAMKLNKPLSWIYRYRK